MADQSLHAEGEDFESCSFVAIDDYRVRGRLYRNAAVQEVDVTAIINAGAGLGQGYYHAFAAYLASLGIATVTYDYRGIGESRPRSLRGFAADVETWGSKDCAAVVNWMKAQFPQRRLAVVGHSVGALVTGFVNNGQLIDKLVSVGGHTGYWRDYDQRYRAGMYVAWHMAMPAIARMAGYFPGRRLGLGDDLPLGVALQWANRRRPELWWNLRLASGGLDSGRVQQIRARLSAIRASGLVIRASDDAFATSAATDRLTSLFESCSFTETVITPAHAGADRIGHFGFFRRRFATRLWARASDWLLSAA